MKAYLYDSSASSPSWTQLGSAIDGSAANDNFGYSVSLASDGTKLILAVGASGYSSSKGQVKGYTVPVPSKAACLAQRKICIQGAQNVFKSARATCKSSANRAQCLWNARVTLKTSIWQTCMNTFCG